jgi:enoyl-CoA hydratase
VLSRIVPRRALVPMMLLGEKLSAAEALGLDLITKIVPDAELDGTVATLTEKLAKQSPSAMRLGLAAYHRQSQQSLAEALPGLEADLAALLGTEDAKEGMRAFFEKREPHFEGR